MEQAITVRYRPTLRDALDLHAYHRRMTQRLALRIGLYALSILLSLLGVYSLLRGVGNATATLLMIGGLYYPVLRPLERRWQIERAFAKNPDKDLEIEWQISDQSMTINNSKWKSELTWPAIAKAVRAPSGLLLYVSDCPYWLPRRGFSTDGAFEELTELMRAKISDFNYLA